MATDICLPVDKFSHAVGIRSDNTVPWTHLIASDLYVVIKGVNAQILDDKLSMRVIQGNKVLEDVDIATYIESAIVMRRRAEQAGIQLQESQLPIFGITKEACLALRYHLGDGKAHRLQLRFQTPKECQQVVGIFARRGMRFQEQRPRTARPGTGRPTTDTSQNRPLTVQTNSPFFASNHSPSKSSPFTQHEVLEAGSLSAHRTSPERSLDRDSMVFEPAMATAHQTAPSPFLSRDEATAPREAVPERPTTSQIYRSQTTPSQQLQNVEINTQYQPLISVAERRSSTSEMSGLEAIRAAVQQHETPLHDSTVLPRPSFPALDSNESGWSPAITAPTNTGFSSTDPVESRSLAARSPTAASTLFADTLEQEIPPRRELPFTRPDSRSSAASLTLPPLPKPKLAKKGGLLPKHPKGTSSSAKDTSTTRPATASPSKTSSATSHSGPLRPETSAGMVNQTWSVEAVPNVAMPPPTAPVSGMRELLYGRKPLEERSPNTKVPRLNSLTDAPHEIVSPPATGISPPKLSDHGASSPSNNAHPAAYGGTISPPHQRDNTSSLEGFADMSHTDQQQLLEDFFAANWDNPDFIGLCNAVGNSWRRISLGL